MYPNNKKPNPFLLGFFQDSQQQPASVKSYFRVDNLLVSIRELAIYINFVYIIVTVLYVCL